MLLSKRLEDFVTCPLCLGLFCEPVRLPHCQHTFCEACLRDFVQQVWQQAAIECPVCKTGCSIHDIHSDNRARSLLEIYEETLREEARDGEHAGGSGEVYTPKCAVCPRLRPQCGKCGSSLDKDQECKCETEVRLPRSSNEPGEEAGVRLGHSSKEKEAKVQLPRSSMETKVEEMDVHLPCSNQETSEEMDARRREIEGDRWREREAARAEVKQMLAEAGGMQPEVQEKLRRRKMAHMRERQRQRDIDRQTDRLEKVAIHHVNDDVRREHANITQQTRLRQQLEEELLMCEEEAALSEDMHLLTDYRREMRAERMAEMDEIRAEMARFHGDIRPRDLTMDRKDPPPAFWREGDPCIPTNKHFECLRGESYSCTQRVDTKWTYYAERLCLIRGELWCAVYDDGIYIYNENCKLKRIVNPEQISKVRSVTSTRDRDILVACDESIGLVRLRPNGTYKHTICPGGFSDVTCTSEYVIALEHELSKLVGFQMDIDTNKWLQCWEYKLDFVCDSWDKLVVNDHNIYVSSMVKNSIYAFRLVGDVVEEDVGVLRDPSGSERSGQCPLLCEVDRCGQPLVCDHLAGQLIYRTEHEGWHMVTMDTGLERPMGAITREDGKNIWVVTRNNQMLKFIKTEEGQN